MAIFLITLSAVVFGFFNKRWAVACSLFVLHIAIGSFIIGCMSHLLSEHQQVASPYKTFVHGKYGGEHSSVMKALKGIRG